MPINNEPRGDEGDAADSGTQGGAGESLGSSLQTGTLVLYRLAWNVLRKAYYKDCAEPVQFSFSRVDGQALQLDGGKDSVVLDVLLPDGSTERAEDVLVSTLKSVPSVQIACLFAFGEVGGYRFDLSVLHDGQLLKTRKCLLVR